MEDKPLFWWAIKYYKYENIRGNLSDLPIYSCFQICIRKLQAPCNQVDTQIHCEIPQETLVDLLKA